MLVKLWKSFPEELKATKSKIICTNVTKYLFVKEKNKLGKYRKCLPCYKAKANMLLLLPTKTKIKTVS